MTEIPDNELVASVRNGSEEAFGRLFHRYKHKVVNYIYRYVGEFEAAQDLTQETFISAYRNLDALRDDAKFSSWLFSIATNEARHYLRTKKRGPQESIDRLVSSVEGITVGDMIPDDRDRPDSQLGRQMVQERIRVAIDSLPPHYREVLLLCDIEGFSYEKAAEITGSNVGTVGSRLYEARKQFKKTYGQRSDE